MARPIGNTPILYGKDASQFFARIAMLPSLEERKKEQSRITESMIELERMIAELKSQSDYGSALRTIDRES